LRPPFPPKKGPFGGGGRLFGYQEHVMVGFWSIFFGRTMGQKNIFGGIFGRSAEILAAQPQMKFQKLEKRRVKIPKICILFTKIGLKVSHHASKTKQILSRVFSPYKVPKSISDLIIVLKGEKWILKRVRNFQMWVKSFKKKFKMLVRILV